MKNLHLIPTDKQSRISLHTTGIYNLACELYENSPNFSLEGENNTGSNPVLTTNL